jgi:Recombination endonuclease VII
MTRHELWLEDLHERIKPIVLSEADVQRMRAALAKVRYMKNDQLAAVSLGAYAMTRKDVAALLILQNSYCACCERDLAGPEIGRWGVDHNRQKYQVRGIVCQSCNIAIRDTERMKKIVAYLTKHGDWSDDG